MTVKESISGDPVDGAVVVIGHDIPPRAMGYTDDRGQVTLSLLGLRGPVDVTAAKDGFSAASVMAFDATNVTLSLDSMKPPSTGPGDGKVFPPGAVTGVVYGIGKYLVLPPGTCADLPESETGFCTACVNDSDCSENAPFCIQVESQTAFCSAACAIDSDCPDSYQCGVDTSGMTRCVPTRGDRQVRCYVSNASMFSSPVLDDDAIIDVEIGEQVYSIGNVRLGEVAIYCVGGLAKQTLDGPVLNPL